MIVYQTKQKTVKGVSAEKTIKLAKDDWSSLPSWFKKKFQENKIMIGGSVIQVENKDRMLVDASGTDIIFIDEKQNLNVMDENSFLDIYEDTWGAKSNFKK